ncbi:hypothetical protein FNV43_RR18966 [Rhamnella rubrinervis]|uniref:Uncharacterized protein n=1 Tax=Rhamnella rubrinervis TaxID=2594499 RepID=A0A8K0GTE8_9ROSA|nr:hypothetical protein FNV43_RR18966 [Rhamnella rubrinervis]
MQSCWRSQNHLKYSDQACHSLSSENFIEPLITFLMDARDLKDVKSQRDGFQLLLTFVSKSRNKIPYLRENAFDLLASFLDSEVTEEVLTIMEVLSAYQYCRPKITASGALTSILKILDSQMRDFQEKALKIFATCLQTVIFVHALYLQNSNLTGSCLLIMKNLCDIEGARVSVVETDGCIGSIAKYLKPAPLVMDEGVIPALVRISVNGNDKGMIGALELLRLLRDVMKGEDEQECADFDLQANRESRNQSSERKSSKAFKLFGRFSKKKK